MHHGSIEWILFGWMEEVFGISVKDIEMKYSVNTHTQIVDDQQTYTRYIWHEVMTWDKSWFQVIQTITRKDCSSDVQTMDSFINHDIYL